MSVQVGDPPASSSAFDLTCTQGESLDQDASTQAKAVRDRLRDVDCGAMEKLTRKLVPVQEMKPRAS